MFEASQPTKDTQERSSPLREQDYTPPCPAQEQTHLPNSSKPITPTLVVPTSQDGRTSQDQDPIQQWIWAQSSSQNTRPSNVTTAEVLPIGEDPNKRVYRSSEISPQYLFALGIQNPSKAVALKCTIISFFYCHHQQGQQTSLEYLIDSKQKKAAPVFSFQLSALNTIKETYWSRKLCRQQIANETLSAFRHIIRNHNNRHNPLPT
ncbi:hypothetical protein M758_UG089600 [Ceratodon purpureus]|nr:hypothetical protein M758_UG089600 [Ceratodon purpureus]